MPIPLIGPQLVEGVSQMLWDFGFRHHSEYQTKWVDGAAGLGMCAKISEEKPGADPFDAMAEEFLSVNNPKILEAVRKSPPGEKAALLKKLEKNFSEISELIEVLKED